MSVDFFPCHNCGESICDCGDYVRCECGVKWCDEDCAAKEGFIREYQEEDDEYVKRCNFCRRDDLEDWELLDELLKHLGWTRQQAVEKFK